MTKSSIRLAQALAADRAAALASRQRMSYSELALVFQASGACAAVPRETMERARCAVTIEQAEAIIVGPTFADTVALNRPFLDLYEEPARRIA